MLVSREAADAAFFCSVVWVVVWMKHNVQLKNIATKMAENEFTNVL